MSKRNSDPLAKFKEEAKNQIVKEYKTVEQFCWDNDLNKATLSNLFTGKKGTRVSTLVKIADALGRELEIRLK